MYTSPWKQYLKHILYWQWLFPLIYNESLVIFSSTKHTSVEILVALVFDWALYLESKCAWPIIWSCPQLLFKIIYYTILEITIICGQVISMNTNISHRGSSGPLRPKPTLYCQVERCEELVENLIWSWNESGIQNQLLYRAHLAWDPKLWCVAALVGPTKVDS